MIKTLNNLTPQDSQQQALWRDTISGSQVWVLHSHGVVYEKLFNDKVNQTSTPVRFNKRQQVAIDRGNEREPIILEKFNEWGNRHLHVYKKHNGKIDIPIEVKNTKETFYWEGKNISGNPDGIDYVNKIVLEIKSSNNKITYHHAIFQVELYMLLIREVYQDDWLNWKFIIAMECPTTLEVAYTFINRTNDYLDYLQEMIEDFWSQVEKKRNE